MNCNMKHNDCSSKFNVGCHGLCDVSIITINGADRTQLNWNEVSVPEILPVPAPKPDIEYLDQVFVNGKINCAKLIETPFAYEEYDILATTSVVDALIAELQLLQAVSITAITDALALVLGLPGLNLVPGVGPLIDAINVASAALQDAFTAMGTAIDTALVELQADCLVQASLSIILQPIILAVELLIIALDALSAAVLALLNFVLAANPALGALLQPLVDALDLAVQFVLDEVNVLLAAITTILGEITFTQVLVLTPNEEGTYLTGRKIVIDGTLEQKVVYTGLVDRQSVHSFCNNMPFTAYIIPYANFVDMEYVEDVEVLVDPVTCETATVSGFYRDPAIPLQVDVCEEFNVQLCIEDIFAHALDSRTVFKNITVFLRAIPAASCPT